MEQFAQLAETFGTLVLIAAVSGIFYVFYRILKYMFDGVRRNDD
jgi:hypothetical protein